MARVVIPCNCEFILYEETTHAISFSCYTYFRVGWNSGLAARDYHVIIIMATENLAENPATGYNTFEPPAYAGPDQQQLGAPNSDQYYPAPPSCKLLPISSLVIGMCVSCTNEYHVPNCQLYMQCSQTVSDPAYKLIIWRHHDTLGHQCKLLVSCHLPTR